MRKSNATSIDLDRLVYDWTVYINLEVLTRFDNRGHFFPKHFKDTVLIGHLYS